MLSPQLIVILLIKFTQDKLTTVMNAVQLTPWKFLNKPKQTPFMNVDEMLNATNKPQETQKLLNQALLAISKSYKEGIEDIQQEIKTQKRISQTAIKNIDEQILVLSQLKKQFKMETMQFNKEGNAQIHALSSHKEFIDKILMTYQQSIQNGFTTINKQYPSESEWKYHLTKIIPHYSHKLGHFKQIKCKEMINSTNPLFKPPKPVNLKQIFNIPSKDNEIL